MGRGVAAFGKARVTDATLVERTTTGALSELCDGAVRVGRPTFTSFLLRSH